jgi:GNAT superfamily N-acetyltransferase
VSNAHILPLPHGLRLIETPSPELLVEVFKLRVRAWGARTAAFPASIESWSDPFDAVAHHFVIVDGARPVAAARLTIHAAPADAPDGEVYEAVRPADAPAPVAAISRLVVCPHHAKKGLSHWLDEARIEFTRRVGCNSVIGNTTAGPERIAQLRALGFRCLHRSAKRPLGALAGTGFPAVLALHFRD